MLYTLLQYLSQFHHGFQVIHYISLRAILASLTALLLSLMSGSAFIRWLVRYQIGQVVRQDGPQSHFKKSGTPTMGGLLILGAISVSTLLWANLSNHYVWVLLFVTLSFGAIGWWDDHLKRVRKNSRGLSARAKMCWLSVFALAVCLYLYQYSGSSFMTQLLIPLLKNTYVPLGVGFILLAYFVIVGSSNAVNLTDGLDGLAILPVVLVGAALGLFAYVTGNVRLSDYLLIPYIPGAGELTIYCGALVGAGLGFLWFNAYPAQVFMGDVGALGLGAALGTMAVIVRQEIAFFIMSGLFVLEAVSVMLQVGSFKLRGKRIFKMAPIHHHFELKGWSEPKVTVRFWIISFILVLCGLATLKIR